MLALIKEESDKEVEVSHISHFGVRVSFIPQRFHYTAAELAPYRNIGDPEMDELLDYLYERKEDGRGIGAFDDVVALASEEYKHGGASSPLHQFYKHYIDVPDWVDFDQLQRGIEAYLAYLPVAGCSLFYRSLVGGFSIPKIVSVLIATRYLVPSSLAKGGDSRSEDATDRDRKRTLERLIDTGGFLACVFAPPTSSECSVAAASLRPGGRGWEAALQVRVLHAKVRRSLLRSKNWDTERDGVPINQEDMAATLLAFSVNVLIGIEIAMGRPLLEKEQRDYLALWRYLGWLLGVDTVEGANNGQLLSSNAMKEDILVPIDPCGPRKLAQAEMDVGSSAFDDTILHSYATLESMVMHLLHPEQSSRELVAHLLSLRRFVLFRSEVCRKFLGDPLSDELGIPQPQSSIKWSGMNRETIHSVVGHWAVKLFMYTFMLYLRWYTLLTMIPPVRRLAILWHSRLWKRFLRAWEKMHAKRMTNAASDGSFCPFSMVMPPS